MSNVRAQTMIRSLIIVLALVPLVSACAMTDAYVLKRPSGVGNPTPDMQSCAQSANTERGLTNEEQSAVAGKETTRLFMNGHPVIDPNGDPAMHMGALGGGGSDAFSDRYAACLIDRGYTWVHR